MTAAQVGFSYADSIQSTNPILAQILTNMAYKPCELDLTDWKPWTPEVDEDSAWDASGYFSHDSCVKRAVYHGRAFALYDEPSGPSADWEDRMIASHSNIDCSYEEFAEAAAVEQWERNQGVKKVGFEIDVVKQHASGQWETIMMQLGGLTADQVSGRQQPCPKCGGRDRFRVFGEEFEETGAMFCNQCFNSKNGDGFSALQWLTGKNFAEVLADVAKFLKIPPQFRRDHKFDKGKHTWADGVDRSQEHKEWLDGQEKIYAGPDIYSLNDLMYENQELRPELIKNILRKGEVFNIIAAPKVGKTFLSMCLAVAVANGDNWLGMECVKGRVLMIDNELHKETFSDRMHKVHMALQRNSRFCAIDVVCLRGQLCDIDQLTEQLMHIEPGKYSLVLLDALYRMLPEGVNESDNAQMTGIWNKLDTIAAKLDASVGVVHHASKGDQSGKDVTDVGSGAGSISRAADTHLIIRAHEKENHAVLEARCRSFKSPEPVAIHFDWPAWYPTTLEPTLKQRKTANELKQQQKNQETDQEVLALLQKEPMTVRAIRNLTGYSKDRVDTCIGRLRKAGQCVIVECESKYPVYRSAV